MHPVREYTYVLADRRCVHKQGGEVEALEYLSETSNGLSYLALFDEVRHPKLWCRESHVLPKLGIEISRFGYREAYRPENPFDYYIDIVQVPEQGECWTVRDLYLDVLVFDGERAEILDTDEYLAALQEGHLATDEAALESAHALLNNLATFGYSLEAYLHSEGVTLTWHRLRSTR